MDTIVIVGTAYPMRGAFAQLNAILFSNLIETYNTIIFSFKRQYPKIFFPGKSQEEPGEEVIKVPKERNIACIDSINPFNWIRIGYKISRLKPGLMIFRYWIPFFAPCFASISFIAKLFSNTKVLFICDNVIPHEKRFGDKFLTKLAFSQVDYFIIQSKTVEKDLTRLIKQKKYKLSFHPLYNNYGDKVEKNIAREQLKKDYDLNLSGQRVILFFGYVRKYKGLNFLIDAMPSILSKFDIKLIIVGEFYDDVNIYKEQIKKLNIENNIILISNFVPSEKVRYFISACDVVVLPYISATQSGIIQLAYFYDKPVIASDVGGLSEVVINNKTGFIVPPGSIQELSGAIIKYYEESLEDAFSENVKQEKKKYEWNNFVKDIENLTGIREDSDNKKA
jgi:glycosyltransferase involved in cell wall biosynthesis